MTRSGLAGVVLCAGFLAVLPLAAPPPVSTAVEESLLGADGAPRPEAVVALLGGGTSRAAALLKLWGTVEEWKGRVIAASEAAPPGAPPGGDADDVWSAAHAAIAGLADAQTDPTLRQYALLESFWFVPRKGDATRAAQALAEIPPESPVWSLLAPDPLVAFQGIAASFGWDPSTLRYAERAAASHPSPSVRVSFLSSLFEAARMRGATDEAQRYYQLIVARYPGSAEAAEARKEFGPDRRIRPGAALPEFSIASLDDPRATLSRETIAGRRVLIEFWATWCGPCVERMPELHRLHRLHAADNFTILSVSADATPRDVIEFRKSRWPMPWLNGFLADGPHDPAWESFEVISIPRLVLVDERGVILATDDELAPDLVSAAGIYLEGDSRR